MPVVYSAKDSSRPDLEVADIFRAHGEKYLRTHFVSAEQRQVMKAIVLCRTSSLGGHVEECDSCGHQRVAYNSCRNRHCPKCQGLKQALWVEERKSELLPIEYFHVVFTLPHELNPLARKYPREVYDLLFSSATGSLQSHGRRELGGEIGITAVLHTWGQALEQHIHLHCIVTGGALSRDGESFRRARQGFLFSVESLEEDYRRRYLKGLEKWEEESVEADCAQLRKCLEGVREKLEKGPWVVYSKRPMAGPAQVIEYLGRYTQRVAISNRRILSMKDDLVRFSWRDYRTMEIKEMELPAEEFIRRYLLHVLPKGFVRVRHYGLLASRGREKRLSRCRELLKVKEEEVEEGPEGIKDLLERFLGRDSEQCERCGKGTMKVIAEWTRGESPPKEKIEREAA